MKYLRQMSASHYLKHYKKEHHEAMNNAQEYKHLLEVALDVLNSMPKPIGQVCGPVTTGGQGSVDKNLVLFEKAVHKLIDQGYNIFNQVPFEKPMQKIQINSKKMEKHERNIELLEEFYKPIFESGLISTLYFIHGWETSQGANWEREQAKRLGIKIIDLPKDFLDR